MSREIEIRVAPENAGRLQRRRARMAKVAKPKAAAAWPLGKEGKRDGDSTGRIFTGKSQDTPQLAVGMNGR